MRLLRRNDDDEFSFEEFFGGHLPRYAILSHFWGNEEVGFQEIRNGIGKDKKGYKKLRFCGEQAARDGLHYFWVDTCCIDKSSSAELTESINSMFAWYHKATRCYVYLSDVSTVAGLRQSRWFTRRWTLQELIAPASVKFFSTEGKFIGDKTSLLQDIHEITGIPAAALQGTPLSQFSEAERMSWVKNRMTTRAEDAAYSLMGMFGVNMSVLYGEGKENAFRRLLRKIQKSSRSTVLMGDGQPVRTVETYDVLSQHIRDTFTDARGSTTPDSDSDDGSEIDSIFSDGESSISSASTASRNPVQTIGIREVSRALLGDKELEAIYTLAVSSVEPKKARSHIRGFLRDYGRNLLKETSDSDLAIQAAKFVRELAGRITDEIIWSITGSSEIPHQPKSRVEKQGLETWLSTIYGSSMVEEQHLPASRADDDEEEEDGSDEELDEDLLFPNIDKVKGFLINSDAFRGLVLAMQTWLKIDGVDRKNVVQSMTDTPKPTDSMVVAEEMQRETIVSIEDQEQADSTNEAPPTVIEVYQQQDAAQEQTRRTRSRQRGGSFRDLVSSLSNFWGISFYVYDIVELFVPHVPRGYRRLRWRCVSSRTLPS
jgi:hypothetical protein